MKLPLNEEPAYHIQLAGCAFADKMKHQGTEHFQSNNACTDIWSLRIYASFQQCLKSYIDTQHEGIALNQIHLSAFDTEHPLRTLIPRHIQFRHHGPIYCTFTQCLYPGSFMFPLLRKVRISSVLQRKNFIMIYEHQLSHDPPFFCYR